MGAVRELDASAITEAVRELWIQINYVVPEDMVAAVKRAREAEESPVAKQILELLVKNQELAAEGEYPYCQDTGYTVVFVDLGQDVHVTGAALADAVDEGGRHGYVEWDLRGYVGRDPR